MRALRESVDVIAAHISITSSALFLNLYHSTLRLSALPFCFTLMLLLDAFRSQFRIEPGLIVDSLFNLSSMCFTDSFPL